MGLTRLEIAAAAVCLSVVIGVGIRLPKKRTSTETPGPIRVEKIVPHGEQMLYSPAILVGTTDLSGKHEITQVEFESLKNGLRVTLTIVPTLATAPEDTPPPVGDWPDLTDWDRVPLP